MKFAGDTPTLTSTDPLCVKVYSDILTNHRLVVGLGLSARAGYNMSLLMNLTQSPELHGGTIPLANTIK